MGSPKSQPSSGAPGAADQQFPRASVVESFQPNVAKHLRSVYAAHSGSDETWTPAKTTDFFRNVQKHEQVSGDDAEAPALDLAGFLDYMASSTAAAILPRDNEDLSWPMSAYFISSSHNTYLSGNQLYSDSTTEAYANVLRRGCRCVEIDVWDGTGSDAESSESDSEEEDAANLENQESHNKSDRFVRLKSSLSESVTSRLSKSSTLRRKLERSASHQLTHTSESPTSLRSHSGSESSLANEPRVLHGYTLTKEVSFRNVCTTIRKHAFEASDLPLIISLEVHCNSEQQAIMVEIMKQAWGDVAVVAPPEDQAPKMLPSPEALRGKILVKVKYAPPIKGPSEGSEEDGVSLGRTNSDLPSKAAEKKKQSKIIRALSDLGVYTRAVSFKSWGQPEASMPAHIFSLSEKKFITHHGENGNKLFEHNREYMMRAYPSGLRIGSSNLNPPPFWGSGAQIVALNWQQTDEGMMLNEGMFGGTNGYILKPEGRFHDALRLDYMTNFTQATVPISCQNQAPTPSPARRCLSPSPSSPPSPSPYRLAIAPTSASTRTSKWSYTWTATLATTSPLAADARSSTRATNATASIRRTPSPTGAASMWTSKARFSPTKALQTLWRSSRSSGSRCATKSLARMPWQRGLAYG